MKEKTLFFLVSIPEGLLCVLCSSISTIVEIWLVILGLRKTISSQAFYCYNVGLCIVVVIFSLLWAAFSIKWQRLGLRYARYAKDGRDGLETNHAKQAANYFLKAALSKFPAPLVNLGLCYAEGFGVEKNLMKAAKCYRMAANSYLCGKKRKSTARLALGVCYAEGLGVEKDLVKAEDLFKSNGYSGDLEKYWNTTEVLMWVQKAAEWGVAKAQCDQGNCSAT